MRGSQAMQAIWRLLCRTTAIGLWGGSLLLCIASAFLWWRSEGRYEVIGFGVNLSAGTYSFDVYHSNGRVGIGIKRTSYEVSVKWSWLSVARSRKDSAFAGNALGFFYRNLRDGSVGSGKWGWNRFFHF